MFNIKQMSIELFNAVRTDNLNRVGELIAAGVDPNLQYSSGYTAYMIAENYGLRPGFTALMLASDKGHLKILNFLINAGANIDLQDILQHKVKCCGLILDGLIIE